jgi:polyisoprenoid-binding protein YceI
MPSRHRFRVESDESAVLIEARSNVGPITFGATGIEGVIELTLADHAIDVDHEPAARLSVRLDSLRSGNALYDAELLRRVDARKHPVTSVNLREAVRIGQSSRYQVTGDLTFHGLTRSMSGTVAAVVGEDGKITVVGEHVFDIRDFDITAPSVLMLRIYPDVRVQLQLVAAPVEEG